MLKKKRSSDVPPDLGEALRARRKALSLTMQSVADQAGLSVGFISQVERGITSPSLSSLVSLAEVLQTDMTSFLQQPASGQTTHKNRRQPYSVTGGDVSADASYERLSATFDGSQLHSVIVHEPPGHRVEPISHRGEEMFYVLDGEITIEIEGNAEILRKGDSIHFNSNRVHSIWNHTTIATSILWCGTMDVFGDAPSPIHNQSAATTSQHKVLTTTMENPTND